MKYTTTTHWVAATGDAEFQSPGDDWRLVAQVIIRRDQRGIELLNTWEQTKPVQVVQPAPAETAFVTVAEASKRLGFETAPPYNKLYYVLRKHAKNIRVRKDPSNIAHGPRLVTYVAWPDLVQAVGS